MKKNIVKLLVLAIAVMSVMLAFASCGCSHETTETIPAVEATCTEAGATAGTKCALCGEILEAPVATEATGHDFKNVNKVDATCTEDGHEAGVMCDCGAIEFGCEKIAAAHKPADIAAKAPTCTEDGAEAGKRCSVCAENLEGFAVVPATGHTLNDVDAIAPSCTVAGSAAGKKCANCDYSEGFDYIEATGHTAKAVDRVEPTCTEVGYEAGVRCEVCQAAIEGCTPIDALGHAPDESKTVIITAAGLGKPGSATSECSVCKAALELVLPALKGGEWNYTSAEDTLYFSKSGDGFVNELVTEGDKTYVRVGIVNPGVHPGVANKPEGAQVAVAGEANMVWKPNETVTLDALTIDNCFVFTTQFRIESYIPKFIPAGTQYDNTGTTDMYYKNWMFNPSISSNPNLSSTDDKQNNHIQVSAVMVDPLTSNEVTALQLGGAQLTLKEWMELKLVYRCDQNDANKYVVEVWVNGVKAGQTNPVDHRANVAGMPILDFRIKFKNARCFDELVLNFDDTKFEQLPYVCDHEYPADATCAAVPACTKCGKTGEPVAHTPGKITEVVAPQIGVAGQGTSVCTVCNAAIEVVIPAIKGATYNYESETDVPRLSDAANLVSAVLKTEGDRTYIEYAFGGEGLDKEWNIFFDADLGQLSTEEYFVFETDIKINSITLTDAYAADLTKTWFMYTGFTDKTTSSDSDTLNRTWYANNADGTKIYLNKNNATDGKEFPYQEWATLKVTVILNADDATKVDIVYYLNGEVLYSHTAAEASKVADGVVSFKLKFKNKKNFVEQSISFDNTKVYAEAVAPAEPEQPVEPEVPAEPTVPTYTFDDGKMPSKVGSSTPDNVNLTLVDDAEGNKVLKLDNKTSGEAVLFFAFENPVMLTNDNYFKATFKFKVGSVVGKDYSNNWIASLGIADVADDRQDNSRLGTNWTMKGDNEVAIGGHQLTAGEWVNVEFYFYTTDAGQTVQQIIVINGEYIGDFTNKKLADDTIKGLTFKTKNANKFNEFVLYFDDVSLMNAALAEGVLPQPPACEHEYPADATCAAAPVCTKCGEAGEPIAHTWADATCTAPKTCSVCTATEGEALGHTPGELNVDLAPTVEAAGHATTNCTVCNAAMEIVLPALPEYTWNYTSETDTLKVGNNASGAAAAELVTEGDKTYVKVTVDNPGLHTGSPAEGDKATKNTELILSWKPDATMDALTANNQFVFNTKVKFDEIVTKWTPAGTQFDNTGTVDKYYQSWLINFCLSTNTNVDNAHDNFNIYIAANPVMKEGTGVVEQVKVGNGVIDMNEWVELTFVFTLNATDSTKCDIVVYMDGISIYTTSQSMKPNVPGNAITDFRIKFKNTRVYDKFVVCFDDSSLDVIAR